MRRLQLLYYSSGRLPLEKEALLRCQGPESFLFLSEPLFKDLRRGWLDQAFCFQEWTGCFSLEKPTQLGTKAIALLSPLFA